MFWSEQSLAFRLAKRIIRLAKRSHSGLRELNVEMPPKGASLLSF